MALEDRYPDILQNIEAIIVKVDREWGPLRDVDVIKVLEALSSHYQRIAMGKEPPSRDLQEASEQVFDAVQNILDLRKEVAENEDDDVDDAPPKRRRFSRALRKTTQEEIFLACLRKIEKSAKRWKSHFGERGYLDFVSNYV